MVVAKHDIVEIADVPRELRGEDFVPSRTTQDLRGLARAPTALPERLCGMAALAREMS